MLKEILKLLFLVQQHLTHAVNFLLLLSKHIVNIDSIALIRRYTAR